DWVQAWHNNANMAAFLLKQGLDVMPDLEHRWLARQERQKQAAEPAGHAVRPDSVFLFAVYADQLAIPHLPPPATTKLVQAIQGLPGIPELWKVSALSVSGARSDRTNDLLTDDVDGSLERLLEFGRAWQLINALVRGQQGVIDLNKVHFALR